MKKYRAGDLMDYVFVYGAEDVDAMRKELVEALKEARDDLTSHPDWQREGDFSKMNHVIERWDIKC